MNASESAVIDAPVALVLGLGITGFAAARWYQRLGVRVRVADTRTHPPLEAQMRERAPEADVRLGLTRFEPDLLEGVREVLLSPGLMPDDPGVAAVLAAAQAAGTPVLGEIELFAQALVELNTRQNYAPQVLAVTGTNGKTTVTALTTELITSAGVSARAAGNIGPAALDALMLALDEKSLPDVWVLELSSFQLETTQSLKPKAAALLNISEDHLDWHGSFERYVAAKARIFQNAELAIVNRGDARVRSVVSSLDDLTVRTFGFDLPVLVGDLGLDEGHGIAWLIESAANDFGDDPPPRRRKNDPPPTRAEGRLNRLMPVDVLQIRGVHNALNAQAALLLARSLDLPQGPLAWGPLLRALREYRGEPHRLEWVRTVMDVDFIDDSKGTNVGATLAALQGLGRKVVLIAGGEGKGQDFSVLAPVVARHARAVVLLGQDAARIDAALADTGVDRITVSSLPEAVRQAMNRAQPGDAVLLSPACASHDMFDDYRHRGAVFVDAVHELALERGEV